MDLNIVIYKDKNRDSNQVISEKIKRCLKLGYTLIALNVHINYDEIDNIPEPPKIQLSTSEIRIITRLTVKVDDTLHTHYLNKSSIAKKYDILSIEPLNEKMLNYIITGNFECDIIYFNMSTEKLPLYFKKANISAAIARGIVFEITYGDTIVNPSCRPNVISGGQIIMEKTKEKNLLLSSACQLPTTIRSPSDVCILGLLFGFQENKSKLAVFKTPFTVLKHSEKRKNVNLSAISIQKESQGEKWLLNELEKP